MFRSRLRSLHLYSALPLPGLTKVALDHQVGIAVDLDLETSFEIAGVVAGHRWVPTSLCSGEGLCFDSGRLLHAHPLRVRSQTTLCSYDYFDLPIF